MEGSSTTWRRVWCLLGIFFMFVSCQIVINLAVYFYKVFPIEPGHIVHRFIPMYQVPRIKSSRHLPYDPTTLNFSAVPSMGAIATAARLSRTTRTTSVGTSTRPSPLLFTPPTVTQDLVHRKRKELADQVCGGLHDGMVKRVVEHGPTNSAYCVSPKVGCTYWLSVYRWLHNDTWGKTYANPLNLPRFKVHDVLSLKHMEYISFNQSDAPASLDKRFKFMFVREPYHRLWSAYVDKFLLPDLWHIDGDVILRHRSDVSKNVKKGMTSKSKKNAKRTEKHVKLKRKATKPSSAAVVRLLSDLKTISSSKLINKNKIQTSCADDITFIDFLDYITSVDPTELNEHYRPFHYLCSPCAFHPDLIGKMETFDNDSHAVLERLNLKWVGRNVHTADERALHEMNMLTEFNFYEIDRIKYFRGCINSTQLAARLWSAFQINGYLPKNISFEWKPGKNISKTAFRKLVIATFKMSMVASTRSLKDQKAAAFLEAYRQVPDYLMERVRKTFDLDFTLFGYDPYPKSLYSHRRNISNDSKNTEASQERG